MNQKDWTGDGNSIYKTLGASNHATHDRANNDYYATDPEAVLELLRIENFQTEIWECAVGGGHIAEVLTQHGFDVLCTDLVDRGYKNTKVMDFLANSLSFEGDIITNPPYKYAKEFIEKSLDSIEEGCKVAMLLKLTFLEGQKRKQFFLDNPPKRIHVFSKRTSCAINGNFEELSSSGAVAYAWYIWEKGFKGKPEINWI